MKAVQEHLHTILTAYLYFYPILLFILKYFVTDIYKKNRVVLQTYSNKYEY